MQRERHPLLTREITAAETELSASVRAALVEVLRPEMARFRQIAGADVSDDVVGSWCAGSARTA